MTIVSVIDSSPLINLVHLGLATKLRIYFDVVYVPRMVQTEVNRKSRFRYRLRKLYASGVFTPCRVVDEISVQLLGELDPGEAEGLVQGSEKGAAVFIADDAEARKMCERRGMLPVGTARLLARMHLEGYAEEPRVLIRKLRRDLNCYINETVIAEALRMAAQPFYIE